MRKSYPSDITREQFEVIRPILNKATKTTHPRKYDLYDIFCAVLYLIKEGCSWRAIPHDYPKWENVRYHYDIWAKPDETGSKRWIVEHTFGWLDKCRRLWKNCERLLHNSLHSFR